MKGSTWWKIYGAEYTRLSIWTSRAMLLTACFWALFFFLSPTKRSDFLITFPEDHTYLLHLSGELTFNESSTLSQRHRGQYYFKAQIKARPTQISSGTLLNMHCRECSIYNHEKRLIVAFLEDNGGIRYKSSPYWTDEERAAIYKSFTININDLDPSSDQSFFRQPFKIYLSQYGALNEIFLPTILRHGLKKNTQHLAIEPFIDYFLNHPELLPPLLKTGKKTDTWVSKGSLISPITLHSRMTKQFGNLVHIQASTKNNTEQPSLLSANLKSWLLHQNKSLKKQDLKIDWEYDKKNSLIKALNLNFSTQILGELLQSKSSYQYLFKLSSHIEIDRQSATIAEVGP